MKATDSMFEDDDGIVTGYMCKVDFECELGCAIGGNMVYPSIEDCRRNRKCTDQCGIVEVRIYASRVVQESNYGEDIG